MGHYTDVVVHVSILEDDNEQDELRLLPELQAVCRLVPVPDCPHVYAGTTKGSHIDKILEGIGAIKWEYPEDVQVWYKDEHNETFRLVMGVQEADKRIVARDNLLIEAKDWLEDLVQIYEQKHAEDPSGMYGWELGQMKRWLEQYKEMRGEE